MKLFLIKFLGTINIGGRAFPEVFAAAVIILHPSAEVSDLTCFHPLSATSLCGLRTLDFLV